MGEGRKEERGLITRNPAFIVSDGCLRTTTGFFLSSRMNIYKVLWKFPMTASTYESYYFDLNKKKVLTEQFNRCLAEDLCLRARETNNCSWNRNSDYGRETWDSHCCAQISDCRWMLALQLHTITKYALDWISHFSFYSLVSACFFGIFPYSTHILRPLVVNAVSHYRFYAVHK